MFQHMLAAWPQDPNRSEDALKVGADGDDAANALWYLAATRLREIRGMEMKGL